MFKRYVHSTFPHLKSIPRLVSKSYLFAFVALCIVVATLYALIGDSFHVSMWAGRDIYRAMNMWHVFETTGAELYRGPGARIPGGAQVMLLWVTSLAGDPVINNYILQTLLALTGSVLVGMSLRKMGLGVMVLATFLFLASPVFFEIHHKIWNPALSTLFLGGFYYFSLRAIYYNDQVPRWSAPMAFLCIAIAQQFHLSMVLLYIPMAVLWVLIRDRLSWSIALMSLFFSVVAFLPHIIHEFINGALNTRLIGLQDDVAEGTLMPSLNVLHDIFKNHILGYAGNWKEFLAYPVIISVGFSCAVLSVGVALRRRASISHCEWQSIIFLSSIIFVCLTFYGVFGKLKFPVGSSSRYIYFALPAFTLLASWGYFHILNYIAIIRYGQIIRSVGLICLVTIGILHTTNLFYIHNLLINAKSRHSYNLLKSIPNDIQSKHDWSLSDIYSRTSLFKLIRTKEPRIIWRPGLLSSINLLRTNEHPQDSSADGPCVALILQGELDINEKIIQEKDIVPLLVRGMPMGFTPDRIIGTRIAKTHILVDYLPSKQGCLMSFANAYALSTSEQIMFEAHLDSRPGAIIHLNDGKKTASVMMDFRNNKSEDSFLGILRFSTVGDEVNVRLSSSQLRGFAANHGFFTGRTLEDAKLEAFDQQSGSKIGELNFHRGRIGQFGVFGTASGGFYTPIRRTVPFLNPGQEAHLKFSGYYGAQGAAFIPRGVEVRVLASNDGNWQLEASGQENRFYADLPNNLETELRLRDGKVIAVILQRQGGDNIWVIIDADTKNSINSSQLLAATLKPYSYTVMDIGAMSMPYQ